MAANTGTAANARYDIDSLKGLFALLLVHTIGPQTIIILPALVNGYVEQLGYSEREAGYLATVETGGMFVAAVALMLLVSRLNWRVLIPRLPENVIRRTRLLVSRLNWRVLMATSLVAMVIANLGSILAPDTLSLYVLRFVAGPLGAASSWS